MKIQVLENPETASAFAGLVLANQVRKKPDSVLGLATGGTMPPVYRELLAIAGRQQISLERISSFNLDEYVGLSAEHPQSYSHFMRSNLFKLIDADNSRLSVPRGDAPDPLAEAQRYEAAIKQARGIDLQLLGLGANGHIGFNEPGASFASRTHVEVLTEDTRLANARFFGEGETVPTKAITMGIATILDAGAILLVATGDGKAEAVHAMIEGPIATACPASALQKHRDVTVVLDVAAARLLPASLRGGRHDDVIPTRLERADACQ